MKQILPILTLTTLTAAAFADASAPAAAASAGLSYNRVSISRNSTTNQISIDNLIGGGNVLVGLAVTGSNSGRPGNAGESEPNIKLGYIFKNVVAGVDATVEVIQPQWRAAAYGVNLRRSLSEITPGLEIAVGYHKVTGNNDDSTYVAIGGASAYQDGGEHVLNYELSYNVNKQFSVAYGFVDFGNSINTSTNQHVVSLRYNY
jgi:hypothetical protein